MELLKHTIFYGSFLIFPFLLTCVWLFKKRKTIMASIFSFVALLIIWARFIEPNIIKTKKTDINLGFSGNIAVISDIHLGLFKKDGFLQRVVHKINKSDIDMLFIAGDITYRPQNLEKYLAPLSDLKIPTYAVFGNHDVGKPGPDIRDELKKILEENGVKLLNNEIVELENFILVGLGSNRNKEDNTQLLDNFSTGENIVVLAHNPDTTLKYQNPNADLTIAGHTHGGQVHLPRISQKLVPTIGKFYRGLTQELYTKLFITSGLGEVGLPVRFFNPPTIDILQLY